MRVSADNNTASIYADGRVLLGARVPYNLVYDSRPGDAESLTGEVTERIAVVLRGDIGLAVAVLLVVFFVGTVSVVVYLRMRYKIPFNVTLTALSLDRA